MASFDIEINARDDSGTFGAYMAKPATLPAPAVIVIQEIFGVSDQMRAVADAYAAEGFLAICPDLFWRQEPGVMLTDKSEAEWDKAFALMNGFDVDKGIEDIQATIDAAKAHDGCTGQVGTVGFCLGGRLAYLSACRTTADANVGYYGVGIEGLLGESKAIAGQLILHIAEEDGFVPKEAQQAIHDGLDEHGDVTLYDYPSVDHAFARPDGVNYDAPSAALANERTYDFFRATLK
ncbi:MAG: dienelactone hydrolase family protein [Pseudomonadota bacterium]